MSYSKTTWASGDVITAEKLNNIENGVEGAGGGAGVMILSEDDEGILNKTWQEIYDAMTSGTIIYVKRYSNGIGNEKLSTDLVCNVQSLADIMNPENITYLVQTVGTNNVNYVATSNAGYPKKNDVS